MKKIRIISIPLGEAPDLVREAWIGLEIPVVKEALKGDLVAGVLTRAICIMEGYWVQRITALGLLQKKDLKAFQWWLELYSKKEGGFSPEWLMFFDENCCEVI